jgi:hypothetical protein
MFRKRKAFLAAMMASAVLAVGGCGGTEEEVSGESAAEVNEDGKLDGTSKKVQVATDQTEYAFDADITIGIKNGYAATAIFVPDCNHFVLEANSSGTWTKAGPAQNCFAESAAVKIKAGAGNDETIKAPGDGVFRVKVLFKTSCKANQKYSECKSNEKAAYSASFTVQAANPSCSDGTLEEVTSYVQSSKEGKVCEVKNTKCLVKNWEGCPLLSPLDPNWCSDGYLVAGAASYTPSSVAGKFCKLPSMHCVTKDNSACPQFDMPPPGWCSDGIVVQGEPRFISSTDGKECQTPNALCVTKDQSTCPATN